MLQTCRAVEDQRGQDTTSHPAQGTHRCHTCSIQETCPCRECLTCAPHRCKACRTCQEHACSLDRIQPTSIIAVREFANKSAASAASRDYVKFQAVIKSAASAASLRGGRASGRLDHGFFCAIFGRASGQKNTKKSSKSRTLQDWGDLSKS